MDAERRTTKNYISNWFGFGSRLRNFIFLLSSSHKEGVPFVAIKPVPEGDMR